MGLEEGNDFVRVFGVGAEIGGIVVALGGDGEELGALGRGPFGGEEGGGGGGGHGDRGSEGFHGDLERERKKE